MQGVSGSIGVILTVPAVAAVTSLMLKRKEELKAKQEQSIKHMS